MKKKLVAVILAVVMTASMLTACGGSKEKPAAAPAPAAETTSTAKETESKAQEEDTAETDADEAESDMVSDENYEILQENYALISDYAAEVREIYTSDEIAANPDIEEVILQTEEIIEEMGELEQADITAEDAQTLNDTMELIIDTYNNLLEGMELVDDGSDAEGGEMVSDETFAELSEAYDALTDIYNTVATAYNESGLEVEEVKTAMDQAYDLLEQMGEISQDTITEADAEVLAQSMVEVAQGLQLIAENLN